MTRRSVLGLLAGTTHGVLLDDNGVPTREGQDRVSKLLAHKPRYAKRIGGDVGQGAPPNPMGSSGPHPVPDAGATVPLGRVSKARVSREMLLAWDEAT
jgi:hypothetical protein